MPDGPGRFTQDSSCPALLRIPQDGRSPRVRGCHPLRPDFPVRSPSHPHVHNVVLQPRPCVATRPVWAPPRSLATTKGITDLFSLPPGTKMFQFPGFASPHQAVMSAIRADGLSHSEIPASLAICAYTGLIAAYHVLHRLREPRHPPCALFCFAVLHYTPPKTHATSAPARHPKGAATAGGGELILSAVVLYTPRNATYRQKSRRNAAAEVLYSLDCVNMSKITFQCLMHNA